MLVDSVVCYVVLLYSYIFQLVLQYSIEFCAAETLFRAAQCLDRTCVSSDRRVPDRSLKIDFWSGLDQSLFSIADLAFRVIGTRIYPAFAKRFQVSELELAAHTRLGKYDMDFLITLSKTNAAMMKVNILSAFYRKLIANEPETNRNARRWEY